MKTRLLTFDIKDVDWNKVADAAEGLSHADLIRAAEDAAREAILERGPSLDTASLVAAVRERSSVIGERNAGPEKSAPPGPPRLPASPSRFRLRALAGRAPPPHTFQIARPMPGRCWRSSNQSSPRPARLRAAMICLGVRLASMLKWSEGRASR